MSRHRDVRNHLRFDDEDFDNYSLDRSPESSPNIPNEFLPPPTPETNVFQMYLSQAQESEVLRLAAEEVRRVLGDNISGDELDFALRASNYDAEQAISVLLDRQPLPGLSKKDEDVGVLPAREQETPSAFGELIANKADNVATAAPAELSARPTKEVDDEIFTFDEPSPDDIVTAARERKGVPSSQQSSNSAAQRPTSQTDSDVVQKQMSGMRIDPPPKKAITIEKKPRAAAMASVDGAQRKSDATKKSAYSAESRGATEGDDASASGVQLAVKQREHAVDEKLLERDRDRLCVLVAGHVDAGKSTLTGYLLNACKDSRARRRHAPSQLAWLLDEDKTERERGVTIDIAVRYLRRPGSSKLLTLIDSPGHQDFVPVMLLGASLANSALLVIDASTGEFEAGFSDDGQTREHAILLRAMGVVQVVAAINKMDTVDFSLDRFNHVVSQLSGFLKHAGFRLPNNVTFVPCSASAGVNMMERPDPESPLARWYDGPTIIEALESMTASISTAEAQYATRFLATNSFRNPAFGSAVSGRLLAGSVAAGDRLLLLPRGELCQVKSLEVQVNDDEPQPSVAVVGDTGVSMGVTGVDSSTVLPGSILCDPMHPCKVATEIEAQIVLMSTARPLITGSHVLMHINGWSESATLSKLIAVLSRGKGVNSENSGAPSSTGGGAVRRPRMLLRNQNATVQLRFQRPLCVELYSDLRAMGRLVLRHAGRTVAVGIVHKIVQQETGPPQAQ